MLQVLSQTHKLTISLIIFLLPRFQVPTNAFLSLYYSSHGVSLGIISGKGVVAPHDTP